MNSYPKRHHLIAFTALFVLIPALAARATWTTTELQNHLKITAPAAGAALEVVPSADGRLLAAQARYSGPPLPALDTIVAQFDPPSAARYHLSFFMGPFFHGKPIYQTGPWWVKTLADSPTQTQFVLWQEAGGEWGCMITLASGGLRTWLKGDGKKLIAYSDSLDSHFAPSVVPLFAIGWDADPYRLIDRIYEFGFKVMREADPKSIAGRRRVEKPFPEIWKYLGWCSWNAYYRLVSQKDLYKHAASFKKAGVPVRWLLIDDGWSEVNSIVGTNILLTGFDADPRKYPGGLKETTRALKQDYGVTWVGVWHTFNGYWNGVATDSAAGRACPECMLKVTDKMSVPDPRSDAGAGFWNLWYAHLKDAGIDFVKVDNQGTFPNNTRDLMPVAHASAQAHRNWEQAADKYFGSNVMDCMEENIETIYQWNTTNLGRAAQDYVPFMYGNPRFNVLNNVMNSLWFTQVLEPDYDMFMSNDWHAEYNLVAHAISGGPVYTTDKAGEENFDNYWPLIYADGLVIRPDKPALPLKKYLLDDPRVDRVPLAAFAPAGEGGLLAVWNIDKHYRPVVAKLGPADVEGLAGDRFAVYDYFKQQAREADRGTEFTVNLGAWGVKLYSLAPIIDGFAALGLVDKYNSVATVKKIERTPGRAVVALQDAGTFAAWCQARPAAIKLNGQPLPDAQVEWADNLVRVRIDLAGPGRFSPEIEFSW